jgi:hypothetical protein
MSQFNANIIYDRIDLKLTGGGVAFRPLIGRAYHGGSPGEYFIANLKS